MAVVVSSPSYDLAVGSQGKVMSDAAGYPNDPGQFGVGKVGCEGRIPDLSNTAVAHLAAALMVLKTYEFDVLSWKAIQPVLLKADIPPNRDKGTACIHSKND